MEGQDCLQTLGAIIWQSNNEVKWPSYTFVWDQFWVLEINGFVPHSISVPQQVTSLSRLQESYIKMEGF